MAVNIGPKIGIDGEAEYRKQLKQIIEETKTLNSEMKKLEGTFNEDTSVKEKNRAKSELLAREQENLKKRVEECRQGVERATEKYGENSEVTEKWKQALNNAETQLGEVNRELENTTGIKAWKAELDEMAGKLDAVGKGMQSAGKSLTAKVTAPLVAVGIKGAASFAEVDKTMQLTNKTMGNTEDEAKLLSNAMKDAAANSTFGMTDAATASLNFARAGLKAEDAAAALAPAMNLAAGEGGDLDTVSAGLVATINGFAGSFDEAEHYADVFANACNNSALDIDSLADSMSIAAPVFSAAGYSVNDAALYMGTMANAGIDANTAATALKTGFARLVSPAKQGAEAMKQLDWSVTNADGTMKDSITIQRELHDKFAGLSESEQIAAASAIFGKNQMSNWLALINTAPEEVQALSDSLQIEGTTSEMADAMMSGFGGSLEKLKSSLDVASTSLGETLAPKIQLVSDKVQAATDWFNGLTDEQRDMVVTVGMVVAAIGPALLILGKLVSGVSSVISIVGSAGAVLSGVSLGPIALTVAAIGGLVAAGVLLYKNWDTVKEKASQIFTNIKNTISNAIERIKGLFNFHWEFPRLKMPHFSWSWMDIGGIVKVPSISVSWYAKAMQNGMILDRPTIFGQGRDGSLLGAGEAGSETVVGTGSLISMIQSAVRGAMGVTPGDTTNYGGVTMNIYGAPGQDIRELADIIEDRLVANTRRREGAWA